MTGECLRKDNPEGQANQSTGTEFGPIGSVRDRFRFTEPMRFFDLPGPSSVSPFGLGISVDGSVGEPLGILQLADSMWILFVGLIIPWSQVRVLAGPPPLHGPFRGHR
jgi:hypothetical protein